LKTASSSVTCFGPFKLLPSERRLECDDVQIRLGGRALDLLIALVEQAGEVISKKELMKRVWPDVVVDEGSLRFHMVALRKALGDATSARYIVNVPGKGYCFAAPVSDRPNFQWGPLPRATSNLHRTFPARPAGVVGRDQIIRTISRRLMARRFVTVVGPGGIGKTTVALCVGHALRADFDDAIHFIDLTKISDSSQVASEIASALELMQSASGMTAALITFLRDKRLLLLLDNCEHVLSEAAAVAERIIKEAPSVHILATSRETLRVEGERVQRLFPLEYPTEQTAITAAEARKYPAVQFFIERGSANTDRFSLDDANVPMIVEICRKLDGIALAIELAACGIEAHGLKGTAALLDGRFTLPFRGKRTAAARHQTLRATLDWSYTLLSDFERTALRRLAIFVGPFGIDDARSVVATNDVEAAFIFDTLASLVSKSLVIADSRDETSRYRLLDTTRTYAREKLFEIGEADATSCRHARRFRELLAATNSDASLLSKNDWLAVYGARIGDVRAALEWSFSPAGDFVIAFALAAAAAPFLLEMSHFSECYLWTERAIAHLDDDTRGTRGEMEIQACFGQAMMLTRGIRQEVRGAFHRGLEIASSLGDIDYVMRFLSRLTELHIRIGDFQTALSFATRSEAVAHDHKSASAIAIAGTLKGGALHLTGDQVGSITCCRAAVGCGSASLRINSVPYGIYDHGTALGVLARALWLGGYPDQATEIARRCLHEADDSGYPIIVCQSIVSTMGVFVWNGEIGVAADNVGKLISYAAEHSMSPYHAIGHGWKGVVEVKRGNVAASVGLLRGSLSALGAGRNNLGNIGFGSYLASALALTGEFSAARELIDKVLAECQLNGESYHGPESLRIKGEIFASLAEPEWDQAEACFRRALEVAREQASLSWELRASMSLARLWVRQRRAAEAREALRSVYARFTEGFGTADLTAAKEFLDRLA
jgi:predicted ATPase/DNA-binding winged helix-turn-helix (wHTH) protein